MRGALDLALQSSCTSYGRMCAYTGLVLIAAEINTADRPVGFKLAAYIMQCLNFMYVTPAYDPVS